MTTYHDKYHDDHAAVQKDICRHEYAIGWYSNYIILHLIHNTSIVSATAGTPVAQNVDIGFQMRSMLTDDC